MTDTNTNRKQTWERRISADIEDVWRALTEPDDRQQSVYDHVAESTWMPGEPVRYVDEQGVCVVEGTVVDVDPPHRLEYTFAYTEAGASDASGDAPSRVTWTMEPEDDATQVTLVHDELAADGATWRTAEDSWEHVLDGLVQLFDDGDDADADDE